MFKLNLNFKLNFKKNNKYINQKMEKDYAKLSSNYEEDIKTSSINNFGFVRERNFYKENNDINNIIQQKPYSILEKTNNIFTSKLYSSSVAQKENINFYSNQNDINDKINNNFDNNINSTIKRIQNKIDKYENDIKEIYKNNNKINIKNEQITLEEKIITNNNINNININNGNDKYNFNNFNNSAQNKGYYFNYRNDESFKKLNEQNTKSFPIDIKLNNKYNFSTNNINNIITSINNKNKNFEYNEFNNTNYKGYLTHNFNDVEKKNELSFSNKNTFDSIKINNMNDNKEKEYNNFNLSTIKNDVNIRNRSLSVNNNLLKQKQLNLDYNEDNNNNSDKNDINIQTNKNDNILIDYNYNNKTNNIALYNTEKRDNIKSYFQLKSNKEYKDTIYNYNNVNNILSLNKSDETLSSLVDETNKEKDNKNIIKNLKHYHSFSIPKNLHINNKINVTENKKDEMTQTIPTNDDELYNSINTFTPSRTYRNKFSSLVDTPSQTYENNIELKHFNTFFENSKNNNENNESNEENSEMNNIKIFNTLSNNNICRQHNKCIHRCNSFRNKKNKNTNNNFNRNICEKCIKSKINFAKLNQMRICKNCQNLINSNYLTFN